MNKGLDIITEWNLNKGLDINTEWNLKKQIKRLSSLLLSKQFFKKTVLTMNCTSQIADTKKTELQLSNI